MLNILLVSQSSQELLFYKSLIEGSFYCEIDDSINIDEAIENLLKKDYELVALNYSTKNHEKLINLIKNIPDKKTQLILFDSKELNKDSDKLVQSMSNGSQYYCSKSGPKVFVETITNILQLKDKTIPDEDNLFCKVHIDYFKYQEQLMGDVYIKLSGKKYLKVFNKSDLFSQQDLDKYYDKNNYFFYVKAKDLELYTKSLLNNINDDIKAKKEISLLYPVHCQEIIKENIQKIGLSLTAIRAADLAISMTLSILKSNLPLARLWSQIVDKSDYISEHSYLLAYICCSVCNSSEWKGSSNNVKLCLAAIFHDITITNESLAKIETLSDDSFEDLTSQQKISLKNHPIDAVKIIEKLDGVPSDVDKIIASHHEQYDGKGFPRGINHLSITPLPALFIQAHLILNELYKHGFSKQTISQAIHQQELIFEEGYFHTNIEALKKALL